MTKRDRHAYILDYIRKNGRITTNELVSKFQCTEDTIRKDFQELTAKGLVQRFHGGVEQLEKGVIQYKDRTITQAEAKEALAAATVPFLLDTELDDRTDGGIQQGFREPCQLHHDGAVLAVGHCVGHGESQESHHLQESVSEPDKLFHQRIPQNIPVRSAAH